MITTFCFLFLTKFFLALEAIVKKLGDDIAKLKQTSIVEPTVSQLNLSVASNSLSNVQASIPVASNPPFNSSLSTISSYSVADESSKTYSLVQSNFSSPNNQSQSLFESSPSFLTTSVELSSENYSENDQDLDEKLENQVFPKWIVPVHKEDQFKNVFFNSSLFDVNFLAANSPFLNWYTANLNTSSWTDFNSHTNVLVDICVKQLETYFSTKRNPKKSRLMHSTERHHLSAVVAFQFPQLVTKYAEFQLQYIQENLNNSKVKTYPNRSTFMVIYL